jgi:DNA-binding CsgD family transcriptional regulator
VSDLVAIRDHARFSGPTLRSDVVQAGRSDRPHCGQPRPPRWPSWSTSDAFADRSWALTATGLRVVQLLPTNLSLADIARRLYVSRNTVKSPASAICRWLGTTSRAEAVERARAAGLIGEPVARS